MNRLLTLSFLVLVVVALSQGFLQQRGRTGPYVDPRLKPDVMEWQRRMDQVGADWKEDFADIRSIEVGELTGSEVGRYNQWSRRVEIDPDQLRAGPYSTRATLWHELGHAAFVLKHGSCRLMCESMSEEEYSAQWPELEQEYLAAIVNNR